MESTHLASHESIGFCIHVIHDKTVCSWHITGTLNLELPVQRSISVFRANQFISKNKFMKSLLMNNIKDSVQC